jgi:hypothetical protein
MAVFPSRELMDIFTRPEQRMNIYSGTSPSANNNSLRARVISAEIIPNCKEAFPVSEQNGNPALNWLTIGGLDILNAVLPITQSP